MAEVWQGLESENCSSPSIEVDSMELVGFSSGSDFSTNHATDPGMENDLVLDMFAVAMIDELLQDSQRPQSMIECPECQLSPLPCILISSPERYSEYQRSESDDLQFSISHIETIAPIDDRQLLPYEPDTISALECAVSVRTPQKNECGWCGRFFAQSYYVKRHVAHVHLNVRPFSCDFCPLSFKRREHLKRHLLCHSERQKSVCRLCDKTFTRSDKLRTHLLGHKARARLVCATCMKEVAREYPEPSASSSEQEIVKETHKCFCGRGYTNEKSLRRHLRVCPRRPFTVGTRSSDRLKRRSKRRGRPPGKRNVDLS